MKRRLRGPSGPAGSGRLAVRRILRVEVGLIPLVERAARARAERDAQDRGEAEHQRRQLTGAASSPHRPVNTTRLITRGLVSARKSRQSAGSAAGLVISMAGMARPIRAWPREEKPLLAAQVHRGFAMRRRMNHRILAAALLAALAAPAFAQRSAPRRPQPPRRQEDLVPVAIDTSLGRIVVALDRGRTRRSPPPTSSITSTPTASTARPSTARCTCGDGGGLIQGGVTQRRAQALPADRARADQPDRPHNVAGAISMANAGAGHRAAPTSSSWSPTSPASTPAARRRRRRLRRLRPRHRGHGRGEEDLRRAGLADQGRRRDEGPDARPAGQDHQGRRGCKCPNENAPARPGRLVRQRRSA